MKTVIIKYNAGNVQSVRFALNRLGVDPVISDEADVIKSADKIIFPGVGEARSAMSYLRERKLDSLIPALKQPFLGICLGMQLMCKFSEEGNTSCLGIFDQSVKKFISAQETNAKVPQIGWNSIYDLSGQLFHSVEANAHQYFVHSYFVPVGEYTNAKTNYILEFSSALQKENFFGVQFHPEKSASTGELILKNFIELP